MLLVIVTLISLAAAAGFAWVAWRTRADDRRRSEARVAALGGAVDAVDPTRDAPPAQRAEPLFATVARPAAGGRALKVAGALAAAVGGTVLLAMAGNSREPAPPAAAADTAALELLAMRHERTDGALSVAGLVRNAGSAGLGPVTAVLFAFDRDGAFLASQRALLERPQLAPGGESPFHVTIPDLPDAGRYQISFRTDAGVLRHVDRRPGVRARAAAR